MRSDLDAVVSALSVRLFHIPHAHVQEALVLSQATPDASLLETLSELGHLRDEEKNLLDEMSQAFLRHEADTLSGYAEDGATREVSPLARLTRIRDLAGEGIDHSASARKAPRYEVRHEHGRGGMGRILAVWDRRMRRDVALKELLPSGARNQGRVIARFLREARITGRLQHPAIIPVHEIGVRDDGTIYYTMKLVRGRTLRQAIVSAETLEARMALLPHYLDLCQAIAYAHAHGVIHRDIKPNNVMIGEFGETQVIDWGLAKELDTQERGGPEGDELSDALSPDLTLAGQLLGTPHYMSPEQAAGKHDQLDGRADVYALGAVLYEILTGSQPYQASTGLEVLMKVASEPPAPPEHLCPEAPAALVAVCRRAMERDPAARYVSAAALAAEITSFQAGARVLAYEYSLAELLARFVRRHRPVVVTAALALSLLVGLGTYAYLSLRARHAAEHDLRLKSEQKGYDLSILIAQRALEEFRYAEARTVLDACPVTCRDWEWGRLSQALQEIQTTRILDQTIFTEAELTPDGSRLLTLSQDGRIKLWQLPEMELIQTYEQLSTTSWSASFRPDGKEFAVYRDGGGLVRYSTDSPLPKTTYTFPGELEGDAITYTPDGRSVVAAGPRGAILEWDLEGAETVRTLAPEAQSVHGLVFSPDGQWLVAAGNSGRLQVLNWATGERVALLDAHMTNLQAGTQGALCIAFSPDGKTLASSGCDATARLWDVATWSLRHTLKGHLKKVLDTRFSPDGSTLATFSERTVRFWDVQSGAERPTWIQCDQNIRHIFFHPDGRHFLTLEAEGRLTQWDLLAPWKGVFLEGHTSEVNAVRFSPDGQFLASSAGHWLSGGDSRVLIWELSGDGRPLSERPVRVLQGDGRWINQLAFHPDGLRLSGADAECKVETWNWQTGDRLQDLDLPIYTSGARCVAYSPDGSRLATAGWGDGTPELARVDLWDSGTGQNLRVLSGPTRIVDSIAFHPDGQWLAAGCRDGNAYVWDVNTGAVVRVLQSPSASGTDWIYGVAFSPDGTRIAGSCGSSVVMVWDTVTGTLLQSLDGLQARAAKVAFNPDGTRVVACDEEMVKVWNVETGAELLSLDFGAQDVTFSPDGQTLAAAGLDGRVGIWYTSPWDGG
ncbi:MAG: serine/threonine protein kinase [Candidatus Hydrogenedentes bacterium]|nr:serine/threonine protein kinase [Candidatus Hydrogenedentota bacterium]